MYIVPLIVSHRTHTDLKQIWIFLERNGSHLIQTDSLQTAKEFLEINGMQSVGEPVVHDDLIFVAIDPLSNELSSFYTWREVPVGTIPSKEVWRPFTWLSSADKSDPFGVNQLLNTIPLAEPKHTVFSTISTYLKTCY